MRVFFVAIFTKRAYIIRYRYETAYLSKLIYLPLFCYYRLVSALGNESQPAFCE
jgi:hypothetical protein